MAIVLPDGVHIKAKEKIKITVGSKSVEGIVTNAGSGCHELGDVTIPWLVLVNVPLIKVTPTIPFDLDQCPKIADGSFLTVSVLYDDDFAYDEPIDATISKVGEEKKYTTTLTRSVLMKNDPVLSLMHYSETDPPENEYFVYLWWDESK